MLLIKSSLHFFLILLFLFLASPALAASEKYVNIVNPVRGDDFFQLENQRLVDNVKKSLELINGNNLVATWLIRPDVFNNDEMINILKSIPQNHELGLFMEVTPSWTQLAQVRYRQSESWHFAGSVFLTGYEVDERQKLIDAAFTKFKSIFGFHPKSVGAWWIDANSLSYMRQKYNIVANMDVSDQYTTDNYQVWGQYFSTPFYPSSRNALVPASGEDKKIGVVTIQWAVRDPFNSYGNGVLDSTYSVQANDYANKKFHSLTIEYFKKLLSIYLDNPYTPLTQVAIGLENDFSWEEFGGEYTRQIEFIKQLKLQEVKVVTMSDFAAAYKSAYPSISPEIVIFAKDPLGSTGLAVWYQTPRYRMGWFAGNGSVVKDLRLFRDSQDEPCLEKRCDTLNLAMLETRNIDAVTYGDQWVIDEGRVDNIEVKKIQNGLQISYTNQLGLKRVVEFLPNDIKVDSNIRPIPVVIGQEVDAFRNPAKIDRNFNHQLVSSVGQIGSQFFGLLVFLGLFLLLIFLPGFAILSKSHLPDSAKLVMSCVIGICIFTLFSFVAGYLKSPWFIWLLPITSLIFIKNKLFSIRLKPDVNIWTLLIIILGSVSWLLTTIKNGLVYDYGLGFWGPHGHDAIWHLAIIESIKKGLPVANPLFSSEVLNNYHYFYDLLIAQLSWVGKLPAIDLYFRYLPILISVLCGLVSYQLAKEWFKSQKAANLAAFFVYFGGSFGWVVTYLKDKSFGGETMFWAQQAISTLINPPFAISVLILLAGLYLFYKVIAEKNYGLWLLIPLVILWGSLIEFKAYAGILVLLSLGFVTMVELTKKNWGILKLSVPTAVLSAATFLPNNLSGSSLLIFQPFWLVHSMIDFPDRLHLMRLSYSRIVNLEVGNWPKLLAVETVGLLIFILGNLGTRILGVFSLKFNSSFNIFIISFLLFSLLLPMAFIQKGANFNTIQFFYYFILVFNFLAAATIAEIANKFKKFSWVMILLVILFTIPTTFGTLQHYLPVRPPAAIPAKELEGLEFLKKQPQGVVLSYYYNEYLKQRFNEPKPLFVYDSTAYVAALSSQNEYLSDTVNMDILGVDFKGRLQLQKDVFALKEPEVIKQLLKQANISYIYAPFLSNFHPDKEKYGLERIFKNEEVEIFKVLH